MAEKTPGEAAPREGPHALISTDVHARAKQPGAAHPTPLRCRSGVACQHMDREGIR